MARFNTAKTPQVKPQGPIRTTGQTIPTHEGGTGFARDAKSELFLLACSNMLNKTFYETLDQRNERFEQLARQVAVQDLDWTQRFVPWLRNKAHMRTASLVLALEATKGLLDSGKAPNTPGGRQLINSAMSRADEPGEAVGYWTSRYGRRLPKPVKRGIADAAASLYTQRSALKYDTATRSIRFGDVLELCHPTSQGYSALARWLVDRGKGRDTTIPADLGMVQRNTVLRQQLAQGKVQALLDPAIVGLAGFTWEDVISYTGKGLGVKAGWESIIPSMNYMALLRNLRNIEQAGISRDLMDAVAARLADPSEVRQSRQLPMRFLSAYRAVVSDRFKPALGDALELSLTSVPTFKGSTLVMIDVSGSMGSPMSDKSGLTMHDAAVIFGLAMARMCENVHIVAFDDTVRPFPQVKGETLLRSIDRWQRDGFFRGGGTLTQTALRQCYTGHDRVVIVTDEQYASHYGPINEAVFERIVPENKMGVTFNVGGYKAAHAPSSPTRVTIGGLSDAAFTLLHALENQASGGWPF